MTLSKPLCAIDAETSGLDPEADRIIELAILIFDGTAVTFEKTRRFNPGIPISAESTAIHGITDADVADCPPFSAAIGKSILGLMAGCDILGYNSRRLDLPILDAEMRRVGLRLDLAGVHVIDAGGIFHKKEPRTLAAAVQKYCGRVHEDAHGAGADNAATLAVLQGQLAMYPDLAEMDIAALAKFSTLGDFAPADLAGKLGYDADGFLVYAFGKQRGVRVSVDPGFGQWMCNRDFPQSTKEFLRAEFERMAEFADRQEFVGSEDQ